MDFCAPSLVSAEVFARKILRENLSPSPLHLKITQFSLEISEVWALSCLVEHSCHISTFSTGRVSPRKLSRPRTEISRSWMNIPNSKKGGRSLPPSLFVSVVCALSCRSCLKTCWRGNPKIMCSRLAQTMGLNFSEQYAASRHCAK